MKRTGKSRLVLMLLLLLSVNIGMLGARINEAVVAQPVSPAAMAAGVTFSLALLSDGTVRAWGANFVGQLGRGMRSSSFFGWGPPAPVKNLEGVAAVSAGGSHSLALKRDGTVWAWGNNGFGQLGSGNNELEVLPLRVAGQGGQQRLHG